jgi:ABC-type branched-subunit amino acid transport system ATPase component
MVSRIMEPAKPIIQLTSIHSGYGKKEILHGVSIGAAPGEIVAVIGANGAGKSTLLKTVAGLLPCQLGHIWLGEKDITNEPPHRRARMGIAYAMQGGAVFGSLTPIEHLELARRMAKLRGVPALDLPPWAAEIVSKPGSAGLLSGGQQQVLAVVTVLASHPNILLCDEPSAGLSPAAAGQLIARIVSLAKESGMTVFCWAEQRIADLLPLADRALFLRQGRVLAETHNPQEWLNTETLSKMTFDQETNGSYEETKRS